PRWKTVDGRAAHASRTREGRVATSIRPTARLIASALLRRLRVERRHQRFDAVAVAPRTPRWRGSVLADVLRAREHLTAFFAAILVSRHDFISRRSRVVAARDRAPLIVKATPRRPRRNEQCLTLPCADLCASREMAALRQPQIKVAR